MTDNPVQVLVGDCRTLLPELPDETVQCCVTSPPYWGLRDYSCEGQLGLEKTPEEYVAKMVAVFREVRRVLRKDGTLWLNLGDSYAQQRGGRSEGSHDNGVGRGDAPNNGSVSPPAGFKAKDLIGIPWRVAFALQSDGWWLRSDIIWSKPNPMPESVTDRPTKSHEYLFLLTKSASYFYDAEAIKEGKAYSTVSDDRTNDNGHRRERGYPGAQSNGGTNLGGNDGCRNKRSVWTVATAPYPEAHFATYPPDLIKPCIMAGTSAKGCCAKCGAPWERVVERSGEVKNEDYGNESRSAMQGGGIASTTLNGTPAVTKTLGWQPSCGNDCTLNPYWQNDHKTCTNAVTDIVPCTVLDPFAGSGTTGMVALELGRKAVLIELNPKYAALIEQRTCTTMGLALA